MAAFTMECQMPSRERRARAIAIALGYLPGRRVLSEEERFWARVAKSEKCWEWGGSRNQLGYGSFSALGRKTELAHRTSWRFAHGDAGAARVCHSCDNPPCVRPDHLFLGSDLDNMADMVAKGRQARSSGEKNGMAKLTNFQVAALKAKYLPGETRIVDLAQEFGITFGQVWQIVSGKKRRSVRRRPCS